MRERQARKILKYKDKLNYSEKQIKTAEQTLEAIEKRKTKKPAASSKVAEKTE